MSKRLFGLAAVAVLAFVATGCGGSSSSSSTTVGSCNISSSGICAQYSLTNVSSSDQTAVSTVCTGAGGTYGHGCSGSFVSGSCSVTGAALSGSQGFQLPADLASTTFTVDFSSSLYTAAQAQGACTELGGTWSNG
ncbi:MAG TPA: hypothetical protein VMK42_01190 [Anaeromyxobacteraceae bacterium]|nr:hypothetical protein [Anaeromyxobacteraceae bacterium]